MHSYILCLSQKSDLTLENFSDVDLFEGAKTVNPFIDYVNMNDNYSPKELANFIVNDIPFLKLEGEKVFLDKEKCEQYLDDIMTNLSVKIDLTSVCFHIDWLNADLHLTFNSKTN